MLLSRLRLLNFRNYKKLDLSLSSGLTVLQGDNGQGKTNLLEAVYYLSLLRSFRTRKVVELKRFSTSGFFVEGTLQRGGGWLHEEKAAVAYSDKRKLSVNHNPVAKASDFVNCFFVVSLTPHDLDLVRGPPYSRRRFSNILAAQTDDFYLHHLINYTAALRNRNVVLRNPAKYGHSALTAYNRLLVDHGVPIFMARRRQVEELNFFLRQTAGKLGEKDDTLEVRYAANPGFQDIGEKGKDEERKRMSAVFTALLDREHHKDEEVGATRYGPHRDDLLFFRQGKPLAAFASEGQIRLFVTALNLTAAAMVAKADQNKPLLLLVDDVFSELDREHQGKLMLTLAEYRQVILACTSVPSELNAFDYVKLTVRNGTIEKE